jgi:hypothetical protein
MTVAAVGWSAIEQACRNHLQGRSLRRQGFERFRVENQRVGYQARIGGKLSKKPYLSTSHARRDVG